jgi:hypothetical protein
MWGSLLMSVTHKLDLGAVNKLLTSPTGGVAKDLLRRGLKVETRAKQLLNASPRRVDTGRLRSSVRAVLVVVNGKPAVTIGTNVKYARYVHDGTGIFGPYSEVIRPVNKKVMKWASKTHGAKSGKGKGFVFAKYTIGMRPNPFLKNALPAARD